ncbi:dienelactone hydrolase family protein [Demequina flava]|uniref:dienelactone hydrolase family protein n=1 Tax=Demequina flava TaxID=1095025 RepID=UPI000785FF4F|nr:dienelactone hydrolase family protein [Demequina flava]
MTTVVLLHSALGPTEHVQQWSRALRADGHEVLTPDFYDGVEFDDLDHAVTFADAEGGPLHFAELTAQQLTRLPGPIVYMGFSLGAAVAEILALEDDRAEGLVMVHGGIGPAWVNCEMWPSRLSAQLHWSRQDFWAEPEDNAALMVMAGGLCEEVLYDAEGHLFAFEGWDDYDAEDSHRLYEHVTDFLAGLDAPPIAIPQPD